MQIAVCATTVPFAAASSTGASAGPTTSAPAASTSATDASGVPVGAVLAPDDAAALDEEAVELAALLDEVLAVAVEQERQEGWIMCEVERGVALPGLYPMNADTQARYDAWKAQRSG